MKDKDGYIAVLGRSDDVLNVAGHRIGTAEVESALVSHPAVAEAAAIGIPDPLKGETIKAFVQVRVDHVPSDALAATLIEHVRRELGPIATPSSLEFVASLPKTRSGKILRRFLKAKEQGVDEATYQRWRGKAKYVGTAVLARLERSRRGCPGEGEAERIPTSESALSIPPAKSSQ